MVHNYSKLIAFLSLLVFASGSTCGGKPVNRKKSATRLELAKDFLKHGKLDLDGGETAGGERARRAKLVGAAAGGGHDGAEVVVAAGAVERAELGGPPVEVGGVAVVGGQVLGGEVGHGALRSFSITR